MSREELIAWTAEQGSEGQRLRKFKRGKGVRVMGSRRACVRAKEPRLQKGVRKVPGSSGRVVSWVGRSGPEEGPALGSGIRQRQRQTRRPVGGKWAALGEGLLQAWCFRDRAGAPPRSSSWSPQTLPEQRTYESGPHRGQDGSSEVCGGEGSEWGRLGESSSQYPYQLQGFAGGCSRC